MRSLGVFVLVATLIAVVMAEPPRRHFNLRSFARQEVAEGEEDQPQGYNYEAPPQSRRLRLPEKLRLRPFARQEEATPNNGYHYPKPTESYGPPAEEATTSQPSNEYGTPQPDDFSTDSPSTNNPGDAESTTNPQAETLKSLQASQLRRQNAKFVRAKAANKQFQFQQVRSQAIIQPQPVVYVDYPYSDLIEPEIVYIFKK